MTDEKKPLDDSFKPYDYSDSEPYVDMDAPFAGRNVSSLLQPRLIRPVPIAIPYCLGYERKTGESLDSVTWDARPVVPYRIRGIFVWGATEQTLIHRFQIGNLECLRASAAPIPALLFSAGIGFAQFAEGVKDGVRGVVLGSVMRGLPHHFEFQKAIDRTVSPNEQIRVDVTGPLEQMVTWGIALVP